MKLGELLSESEAMNEVTAPGCRQLQGGSRHESSEGKPRAQAHESERGSLDLHWLGALSARTDRLPVPPEWAGTAAKEEGALPGLRHEEREQLEREASWSRSSSRRLCHDDI